MARASLRSGAVRREMLPHCVQQPGARPQPKEAGHGNLPHPDGTSIPDPALVNLARGSVSTPSSRPDRGDPRRSRGWP